MLNRFTLIGRLGQDPQLKKIGDKDLATFSVAYSEKVKGEEKTTWFNCEVWGAFASVVQSQAKKGDKITVIGRIVINEHEGKQYIKVIASEVVFL
jgi:single-strand DNA-binding protein